MKQIVFIGSDHAGFKLKEKIKSFLADRKFTLVDFGAFSFDEKDDYPDFVIPVAKKVAENKKYLGIVLGGSGEGEAIAANKVRGARAVVFYGGDKKILKLSKEHNNANILSLGARFLTENQSIEAVELWLNTRFSNETRHVRRLKKIEKYEK